MHAVVIQPLPGGSAELAAAVSSIPYIKSLTSLPGELFAIARIRQLRPDVIFLPAEGWVGDTTGLLSWLRSHRECKHVIMVRTRPASSSPPVPRITGVPVMDLPRDEARLAELLGVGATT